MKNLLNIPVCIGICAFFITTAIKFTIVSKDIYIKDVEANYSSINSVSKITMDDILKNYNYVVCYLTEKKYDRFCLPTLPSSHDAIEHFLQVKKIFTKVNIIFYSSILFISLSLFSSNKDKLKAIKSSILSLVTISIFFALSLFINFNKTFILFHKLLFNNDYWIFDPDTDPIITLLPESYFYLCTLEILILILISCILLLIVYKKLKKTIFYS